MIRTIPLHLSRAEAVADFMTRNRERFRPFAPARTDNYYAVGHWRSAVRQAGRAWREETAFRYVIEDGTSVVGKIDIDPVQRGPFQSGTLGYLLCAGAEGRGVMAGALRQVLAVAFAGHGLHRMQAAIMPDNARSLALIRTLGFREIGLAERYLLLDGVWRDHLLFEKVAR